MTATRRCAGRGATSTMNQRKRKKKDEAGRTSAAKTWGGKPVPAPTPVLRGTRIGRNAPCPCKSGKKFKQCCGVPKTYKAPRPKLRETRTPPGETRQDVADAMRRAKMRPELVYAYEKTGTLVTAMNRASLPAATVATWDAAAQEYEEPAAE